MSLHARSHFPPDPQSTAALDIQAAIVLHQVIQLADCDGYHAWLAQLIAPHCGRRYIAAQTALFDAKDTARYFYLVVAGEFLVQRRPARHGKPDIRMLTRGDFFIYDCGGRHAASCYATQDSIVLPIERQWLETLARRDRALADVLKCVHSTELQMILESLQSPAAASPVQQPGDADALSHLTERADAFAEPLMLEPVMLEAVMLDVA